MFKIFILLFLLPSFALRPDALRVGLLRYGTSYDPYPDLWRDLAAALEGATSVETEAPFRASLAPTDQELAKLGVVFLMGSSSFPGWTPQERQSLRQWIVLGGGLLVILNTDTTGAFDSKIRKEIAEIFGASALKPVSKEHALFKSFYLVRSVGGVTQRSRVIEGILTAERYGLLYSANDLGGALVKDGSGSYLFSCYPGGEEQRKETFKMLMNIFIYALTGTYKSDIIHSPFIEQKLKR